MGQKSSKNGRSNLTDKRSNLTDKNKYEPIPQTFQCLFTESVVVEQNKEFTSFDKDIIFTSNLFSYDKIRCAKLILNDNSDDTREKVYERIDVKMMSVRDGFRPISVKNLCCNEFEGEILPFNISFVTTINSGYDFLIRCTSDKIFSEFKNLTMLVIVVETKPINDELLNAILSFDQYCPPKLENLIIGPKYPAKWKWLPDAGSLTEKTLPIFLRICSKFELQIPSKLGVRIKSQEVFMEKLQEVPMLLGPFSKLYSNHISVQHQRRAVEYIKTNFKLNLSEYYDKLEGTFTSGYCLLQAKPSDNDTINLLVKAYNYVRNPLPMDLDNILDYKFNLHIVDAQHRGGITLQQFVERIECIGSQTSSFEKMIQFEKDFTYVSPDNKFMILDGKFVTRNICTSLNYTKPIIVVVLRGTNPNLVHYEVFTSVDSSFNYFVQNVIATKIKVEECVHKFVSTTSNKRLLEKDLIKAKVAYINACDNYKKCISIYYCPNHDILPFAEEYNLTEEEIVSANSQKDLPVKSKLDSSSSSSSSSSSDCLES
jgi:hypothetical protein